MLLIITSKSCSPIAIRRWVNLDGPKVLVIIPAYNEERSIARVIADIKRVCAADITVIDDGSSDSTAARAASEGVTVISLPFNLGIGGAMQTGYIFARDRHYDIAVQVDGDGQHDPGYLDVLLGPVISGLCDMAIGSRFIEKTSYKSAISRRVGIAFFSWLVWILTGKRVKDPTSGFRAVNRKLIEYFSSSYPTDYPEVDVLVRLYKKDFKIREVPVEMKKRRDGISSITAFKSAYYMVKVSLAILINSMRSGELS